jgi:hypothetical protein
MPPLPDLCRVSAVIQCMDRMMISLHLAQADERVRNGTRQVERQRTIVSQLDHYGRDATRARKLLAELEKLLAMHVAERERLIQDLNQDYRTGP